MTARITSQPTQILRPAELPQKNRGGGARTVPLVTYGRGATSFLNGTTQFDPGSKIGHHTHNVAESVMVVEGTAVVDIDGERTELSTYDTTFVPANIPHHFENASDEEPMRIFWTYGSIDATRTMTETGEYGRIDGESTDSSGPSGTESVEESAVFTIKEGCEAEFEDGVRQAVPLFQRATGARTLTLKRSVERAGIYHLSIRWDSVDDHNVGFRKSEAYSKWRELVSDCFAADPQVEHLSEVLTGF